MSITVWIVLAFLLGVLFGRMTARSSSSRFGSAGGVASSDFGTATTASARLPGSPGGAYRIVLLDSGPNKINSIKAVREVTRLDLKGAKDLVDAAPSELIRVELPSQAEQIARRFQGVANVRVEGPPASVLSESGGMPGAGV